MHRIATNIVLGIALFVVPVVGFAQIRHYEATNCEIHVEKFRVAPGSYNSINANIYLKVAIPHLDGAIKEVGFRLKTITTPVDVTDDQRGWHNMVAVPLDPFGTSDQFKVSILLKAGERSLQHEGVFYVLTDTGTMYWLHPLNDMKKNFLIGITTFTMESELMWEEMWINDYDHFLPFNPERCT